MARQHTHTVTLDQVAQAVTDLHERVERLEQLVADRMDPAVTAAAVVVDEELCALARVAAGE